MDLGPAIELFIVEAEDLLSALNINLAKLEQAPTDKDAINCVFRAAHTIKGSAGLFGFDKTVAFTHDVESVLMSIRDGDRTLDKNTLSLLIKCSDQIAEMVEGLSDEGESHTTALLDKGERLLQQLGGPSAKASEYNKQTCAVQEKPDTSVNTSNSSDGSHYWHISLRFSPSILQSGMDPIAFIRFLSRQGEINHLTTLGDNLPNWEHYNAEYCYLGFEISLDGETTKSDIEDVFEFIKDDLSITILPPKTPSQYFIDLIKNLPESDTRLGDILVQCGAITEQDLIQALGKQEKSHTKSKRERQVLRVDTNRLDSLINLIGELVISGSNVSLLAEETKNPALIESIEVMSHLIEEVRGGCLSLRMVKISQIFSKSQRIVRDLSQNLNKDIKLIINGEDTELDKSMAEKISDPLVHLIRNAIDHGIEPSEHRLAQGKPSQGTISLTASYDSGYIIIELKDDGRGLNKDRIINSAIELGHIKSSKGMTDSDIYQLILMPGLSTSDNVSSLSGRGVGMDVVRRNIEELRGSIEIYSTLGKGSCITIRLPLTLAIIDGFLIGIDNSRYILPLDSVVECVELSGNDYHIEHDNNYMDLRGEILPILRLRELFGQPIPVDTKENIVIVESGKDRAGIIVDELYGEFQTVVKPMSNIFDQLNWINGSTILGNGSVAIILEVSGIIRAAKKSMDLIS